MTTLNRRLKRVVPGPTKRHVVILNPAGEHGPATIEVREAGRRTGHSVTVGGLYTMLAIRAADAKLASRRPRRGSLLRKAGAR